ncbi:MAG: hypothetical protein ACLSG8_11480 [Barnesiella sp.]
MRNIYYLLVVLIWGSVVMRVSAQSPTDKEITLFEVGAPLSSDESNFSNLFCNFPRYIENRAGIELVSYKKVGTVKSRSHAQKYLKNNFGASSSIFWDIMSHTGSTSTNISKEATNSGIWLDVLPTDNFEDSYEMTRREKRKQTADSIDVGDSIYEITFNYDNKQYVYYVFVDPQSHAVVTEGNILHLQFHTII